MLFNSLQFAIFFLIVYSLYLASNHRWQNRLLLVASFIFYGAWDWRFLSLISLSITLDYFCSLKIHQAKEIRRKKQFLFLSVLVNLSILGFFKYFNFFAASLQNLLNHLGISLQTNFLKIILPVGISFYTFQSMSYTLDVYRGQLQPTNKFFDYALFVSFFPQLVAGPIERAMHLLPQVLTPRKVTLEKFYAGLHLIFWGLFLKIFVADNLAKIVNPIFASTPPYQGIEVLFALYAFAFQIFCDFAGYSHIARGLGKCMGFEIMVNFNLPYFATNPREFWQRWHISLSTWLRDYLYIPLGGNRRGTFITYRNIAITMLLGGLWHGAAWTFVLWGAYHGILLIVHRLLTPILKRIPSPKNFLAAKLWFFIRMIFFFHLISLSWLLFRAQSLTQVSSMFQSLFFNFNLVHSLGLIKLFALRMVFFLGVLLIVQGYQYAKNDLMAVPKSNLVTRVAFYYILTLLLIACGVTTSQEFIYFQF